MILFRHLVPTLAVILLTMLGPVFDEEGGSSCYPRVGDGQCTFGTDPPVAPDAP